MQLHTTTQSKWLLVFFISPHIILSRRCWFCYCCLFLPSLSLCCFVLELTNFWSGSHLVIFGNSTVFLMQRSPWQPWRTVTDPEAIWILDRWSSDGSWFYLNFKDVCCFNFYWLSTAQQDGEPPSTEMSQQHKCNLALIYVNISHVTVFCTRQRKCCVFLTTESCLLTV